MTPARAPGVIDLRSDTVTQPSPEMRRAMLEAPVGDDVLDGDPTTERLQARIADLLDVEAALFFPSGVQANQAAMWLHTEPGTEVLVEGNAHVVHYELAALAALAGVQIRPVATADGVLTAAQAEGVVREDDWYLPRLSAVAVENTHNAAGGKVMPLDVWDGLVQWARDRGLPVHLDGARLWNAAAALGQPAARCAQGASSVMVSLSKGLGCPVGSCLAGPGHFIDGARRVRRRLGGAMRQTGILAAAGLYALEHNMDRIGDDHARAALLAARLRGHACVRPTEPETNILLLDLVGEEWTAVAAQQRLAERGVLVVPVGRARLRAVTHLDLSEGDVTRAAAVIAETLAP